MAIRKYYKKDEKVLTYWIITSRAYEKPLNRTIVRISPYKDEETRRHNVLDFDNCCSRLYHYSGDIILFGELYTRLCKEDFFLGCEKI